MTTPERLTGKVAIVTASSDGIGLAIVRRFLQDGAKVMLSSRKQQNVDKAVGVLRAEGFLGVAGVVCHVAKKEDRQKMIDETISEFGGIDIVVSNAANNPTFGPILNTTETAWDKVFDVNVKATFFLVKEVVPYIEKRGGGSVILVSSQAGYVANENMGPYGISKTALLGMTKALVHQLAEKKIRVNTIAPSVVRTRFAKALWENENIAEVILNQIPLRRFGVPEDCANLVSFLVSDDASYITGETVTLTGGQPNRL